jgi:hypothetical protein
MNRVMYRSTVRTAITALAATLVACGADSPGTPQGAAAAWEVWMIDQSDSPGRDHGGTLYIFNGAGFSAEPVNLPAPAEVIDLAAESSALCRERTGANPVRPHMVLFNHEHTHASVAFVVSGHVLLIDAASREPLDCIRTTQAATGQQAHAAYPSADGSYILVANQNGKRLERIDTDFGVNRFTHNTDATLDLATCSTPSGAACEADGIRPDNAPICPVLSDSGDLAFVTLRGGGLLVVDPRPTPMRIVAEYDMATVKGNGCGGEQVGDQMYVNSGGRPGPMDHLHLYGFEVYRFALADFAARGEAREANTPAPVVVFSRDGEHDSHGMVVTGDGRYLWVMDRHGDVVEVLGTADDRHIASIPLNGVHTDNAAPDLTDRSPDGDLVFVAFRGPTPLSGDPHIATGTTPGLGVLAVTDEGRSGEVIGIVRISNVGADGVERADPHGLRVRQVSR